MKIQQFQILLPLVALFLLPLAKSAPTSVAPATACAEGLEAPQPLTRAQCRHTTFRSSSLARDIDLTVILPPGYRSSGEPWPWSIFLHGRGGDRDQLLGFDVLKALEAADREVGLSFVVVAPSGGNHYWVNAAISGEKWGDLVAEDLVRWTEKNLNVVRDQSRARALWGISMGGAGTLQLGLRHPKLFATAASISPVFRREPDIGRPGGSNGEPIEDHDSFGEGADFQARSPRDLCEAKGPGRCLSFQSYRLQIGTKDFFLTHIPDTKTFAEELARRHAGWDIAIRDCPQSPPCSEKPSECQGHAPAYWRCEVPRTVRWLASQLKKSVTRKPAQSKSTKGKGS